MAGMTLCNRIRRRRANHGMDRGLVRLQPDMTEDIRTALTTDRTIDITTTGRKTGRERRLEMWFHNVDGRIYITGMPGTRSWYANLLAHPEFTFHLKESVRADLPATARPILDEDERRSIFNVLLGRLGYRERMDSWMARSPLVEVTFA
jgi:deazaflavin-dependent oxidoreductase (nitroreductase family)